jgi:hypothetical protein
MIFWINFLNFNLGVVLKKLLKMLLQYIFRLHKRIRCKLSYKITGPIKHFHNTFFILGPSLTFFEHLG